MRELSFTVILLFLESCIFIRMDDSIDLGDHYRYIQDYPQTIVYYKSDEYNGNGLNAVPPIVLDYSFNDNWVIARNIDMTDGKVRYWIIDKKKEREHTEPLDSLTFYNALKDKSIGLKLK